MDAVERRADIEGARAERIVESALHVGRQARLAPAHLGGRGPARPLALAAEPVRAAPFEAVAGRADAVAHGLAVAENEVEVLLAGDDDDRARLLMAGVLDDLARE